MEKLYFGTNTKMTKTIADTLSFLRELDRRTADLAPEEVELFVIPSFTTLESAGKLLEHSRIRLGAQNMSWAEKGAFTGEISAEMLRECGVTLVELGHSERRHVLGETDEMIRMKVEQAFASGLGVLLCVGETARQKELGLSREVLATQVKSALANVSAEDAAALWIAYEPVWAIGESGVPATAEYAGAMHDFLRQTLCDRYGEAGARIPLLYGGSVNPDNACGLIRQANIDGLFVGRSAWDAENFDRLVREVKAAAGT